MDSISRTFRDGAAFLTYGYAFLRPGVRYAGQHALHFLAIGVTSCFGSAPVGITFRKFYEQPWRIWDCEHLLEIGINEGDCNEVRIVFGEGPLEKDRGTEKKKRKRKQNKLK